MEGKGNKSKEEQSNELAAAKRRRYKYRDPKNPKLPRSHKKKAMKSRIAMLGRAAANARKRKKEEEEEYEKQEEEYKKQEEEEAKKKEEDKKKEEEKKKEEDKKKEEEKKKKEEEKEKKKHFKTITGIVVFVGVGLWGFPLARICSENCIESVLMEWHSCDIKIGDVVIVLDAKIVSAHYCSLGEPFKDHLRKSNNPETAEFLRKRITPELLKEVHKFNPDFKQ